MTRPMSNKGMNEWMNKQMNEQINKLATVTQLENSYSQGCCTRDSNSTSSQLIGQLDPSRRNSFWGRRRKCSISGMFIIYILNNHPKSGLCTMDLFYFPLNFHTVVCYFHEAAWQSQELHVSQNWDWNSSPTPQLTGSPTGILMEKVWT
jgi:hypothetical protein